MDGQFLFNIFVGLSGTLGGFILSAMWTALKDLQSADKELTDKVSAFEILVAGQYVKRDQFESKIDALFRKLDSMEAKLDEKLDRAISKRL